MPEPARAVLLGPLLKSVSRSFYITLRVLPAGMRDPIGLAYLLARAADTIADTSLIPPGQRMALLLSLRNQVNGAPDEAALMGMAAEVDSQQADLDEKALLESLGAALTVLSQLSESDREAVRDIVTTLTEGMVFDLHTFPDESSGRIVALREFSELDQYTYMVAGCVGEFWMKMTYVHVPGTLTGNPEVVLSRGIRFGKALQMTNVLRDCGNDLRIGRCYLPSMMLDRFGLSPQDLLLPKTSLPARPLLFELVGKTLDHFREAIEYTLSLPAFRGTATVGLFVASPHWVRDLVAARVQRPLAGSGKGFKDPARRRVPNHCVLGASGRIQSTPASLDGATDSRNRSPDERLNILCR